jgi:hypothetical protein
MASESEDGETLPIPPSIQAVIAERLDRLDPNERAVIESAAVVGKEFLRGAVVELTGPETRPAVGEALRGLVRKGLMRPHLSAAAGEDGFRFGHVLIRDVAYEAMPKQLRAELHERFPDWIERNTGGRTVELEEIVAYHLEQAHRYRSELGSSDERSAELAGRASALLARAGRRAFAREDLPAARNLLERALALGEAELEARLDLAGALWGGGDGRRAEQLLAELVEDAGAAGDTRLEWYGGTELEDVARRAVEVFGELGDDLGLARAYRRLALVSRTEGLFGRAEQQSRTGLDRALAAGDQRERARLADTLCSALLVGPAAVSAAAAECEQLLADSRDRPAVEAGIETALAGLRAMHGRFGEERDLDRLARSSYD